MSRPACLGSCIPIHSLPLSDWRPPPGMASLDQINYSIDYLNNLILSRGGDDFAYTVQMIRTWVCPIIVREGTRMDLPLKLGSTIIIGTDGSALLDKWPS